MNAEFISDSRFLPLVFALLTGFCVSASAIELSGNHAGQYLIVPFALATDHYDTLLQVSNGALPNLSNDLYLPRALKLRILDQDGIPVLTGNLYLKGGETWTGGLAVREGSARLISSSEACLLIDSGDGLVSLDSVAIDFESGFIEWVEMGVASGYPDHQDYRDLVNQRDCDGLMALWSDPDWAHADAVLNPPAGSLRATASLINVERGTMYSLTATALNHFSTIAQHTDPSSPEPNLSTTFDEGTPNGETRSVVCRQGECVTSTWPSPLDAASAALMVTEAYGDYVISDSMQASTEWVVTYPTRAYYPDEHTFTRANLKLLLTDRSGRIFEGVNIGLPPPGVRYRTYGFAHERSLHHLDFNTTSEQFNLQVPGSVFGIDQPVLFPSEHSDLPVIPDSGQARVGFESNQRLISNEGTPYVGRPAIAWVFQEIENGVLEAGDGTLQRANYGNAFKASMEASMLHFDG